MIDFRTSASHLIIQGVLLASLIVLTMMSDNFDSLAKIPVLIIADAVVFSFLLSSIARRVTINGDTLETKTFFRKADIKISQIEYAQGLSAFARWVVILNDGNRTAVLTSLLDGMEKILDIIRPHLKEEDLKRIETLTAAKIKTKKRVYNSVIIFLTAIVWYGIFKTTGRV